MEINYGKPTWWLLYMLLILIPAALLLEERLSLPTWEHKVAGVLVIFVVFALIGVWLLANAASLEIDGWPHGDEHLIRSAAQESALRQIVADSEEHTLQQDDFARFRPDGGDFFLN